MHCPSVFSLGSWFQEEQPLLRRGVDNTLPLPVTWVRQAQKLFNLLSIMPVKDSNLYLS